MARQPNAAHQTEPALPQRPRVFCSDSLPWPELGRYGLSTEDAQTWLAQQQLAHASVTPPVFAAALITAAGLVALFLWMGPARPAPPAPAVAAVAATVRPIRVVAPKAAPAFSAGPLGSVFSRPNPL